MLLLVPMLGHFALPAGPVEGIDIRVREMRAGRVFAGPAQIIFPTPVRPAARSTSSEKSFLAFLFISELNRTMRPIVHMSMFRNREW